MRPAVYRMYDADEVLLYVGQTTRGLDRLCEHTEREWWRDVDLVTVEHFATVQEADAAERAAVFDEKPRHNKRSGGAGRRRSASTKALARDTSQQKRWLVEYAGNAVEVWAITAELAEIRVRHQVFNRYAFGHEITGLPAVVTAPITVTEVGIDAGARNVLPLRSLTTEESA